MTKKYLLFSGSDYYPSGGFFDFIDVFDSVEEAVAMAIKKKKDKDHDWYHVVDAETFKILEDVWS
jgi:hypothetical protein